MPIVFVKEIHRLDHLDSRHERVEDQWTDGDGAVLAEFYAVGIDPAGAVAGSLDDDSESLMGAFGAIRQ